jgi:hypothetical protein
MSDRHHPTACHLALAAALLNDIAPIFGEFRRDAAILWVRVE